MEQKSSKLLRKSNITENTNDTQSKENRSSIVKNRLIHKKASSEQTVNKLLTSVPLSMQNTMDFIDNHNKHAKTIKHDDVERKNISDAEFFQSVSRLSNNF